MYEASASLVVRVIGLFIAGFVGMLVGNPALTDFGVSAQPGYWTWLGVAVVVDALANMGRPN